MNVLEMKCLRSLVGMSRMDRVRNEEVKKESWNRQGVSEYSGLGLGMWN